MTGLLWLEPRDVVGNGEIRPALLRSPPPSHSQSACFEAIETERHGEPPREPSKAEPGRLWWGTCTPPRRNLLVQNPTQERRSSLFLERFLYKKSLLVIFFLLHQFFNCLQIPPSSFINLHHGSVCSHSGLWLRRHPRRRGPLQGRHPRHRRLPHACHGSVPRWQLYRHKGH